MLKSAAVIAVWYRQRQTRVFHLADGPQSGRLAPLAPQNPIHLEEHHVGVTTSARSVRCWHTVREWSVGDEFEPDRRVDDLHLRLRTCRSCRDTPHMTHPWRCPKLSDRLCGTSVTMSPRSMRLTTWQDADPCVRGSPWYDDLELR